MNSAEPGVSEPFPTLAPQSPLLIDPRVAILAVHEDNLLKCHSTLLADIGNGFTYYIIFINAITKISKLLLFLQSVNIRLKLFV
jgi:hypothetical protein